MSFSFLDEIASAVERSIEEFARHLEKERGISAVDVLEIWREVSGGIPKTPVGEPENEVKCPHATTRAGKNSQKGKVCGTAVSSGTHCAKHKSREDKPEKRPKKVLPKPRSLQTELKEEKKLSIRRHARLGMFWHPETKFVIKEEGSTVVVGKVVGGKVVDLEDGDGEACVRWGFVAEPGKKDLDFLESSDDEGEKEDFLDFEDGFDTDEE